MRIPLLLALFLGTQACSDPVEQMLSANLATTNDFARTAVKCGLDWEDLPDLVAGLNTASSSGPVAAFDAGSRLFCWVAPDGKWIEQRLNPERMFTGEGESTGGSVAYAVTTSSNILYEAQGVWMTKSEALKSLDALSEVRHLINDDEWVTVVHKVAVRESPPAGHADSSFYLGLKRQPYVVLVSLDAAGHSPGPAPIAEDEWPILKATADWPKGWE